MLCPGCCDASPGPPSKGSSSPPRPSAAALSEGDIFCQKQFDATLQSVDCENEGILVRRSGAKICMCACEGCVRSQVTAQEAGGILYMYVLLGACGSRQEEKAFHHIH